MVQLPKSPPKHQLWRMALGFFVAPLIPATVWILSGAWPVHTATHFFASLLLIVTYGGYPATVLLGLPAYFVVCRVLRPRLLTVTLTGGFIAAAPWLVLVLMISNGEQGYLKGMKFLAMVFGLGLIGGIAFWICAFWRSPMLSGPSRDSVGG